MRNASVECGTRGSADFQVCCVAGFSTCGLFDIPAGSKSRRAADLVETREIDWVLVVGKTEPQRIFELLGRKGEVASERLALRDAFVEALGAYHRQDWEAARTGFENCLAIIPGDRPSKVFLSRIAQFHAAAPSADWDGVWSLAEK